MGPGQNFLTQIGSGQIFVAWDGSAIYGLIWVWIWKISPNNIKFFNFFHFGSKKSLRVGLKSTQVKGGSASYLLQVKSKLGSGRVRAHLYKTTYHSQSQPILWYIKVHNSLKNI